MPELLRLSRRVFTHKRTWYGVQCTLGCGVMSIAAIAAQAWDYAIFASLATAICAALTHDRVRRTKEDGDW